MIAFVIVAGGSGRRMNAPIPKQYMMLGDRPILIHTLQHALQILSSEDRVILVVPRGDMVFVSRMINDFIDPALSEKRVLLTEGGDTRTDSVRNGLALIGDADIVAIHDSVRVFFTKSLVTELITRAAKGEIAVPVQEATDSVIISQDEKAPFYIPRHEVHLVKTPQIFSAQAIKEAYKKYDSAVHGTFTDDASLVKALMPGARLALVPMNFFNNKITYPTDIELSLQALKSFDPMS